MPRKSPGLSRLANSASRTSATICADSEEERPANMMRAVKSPLVGVTVCLARGWLIAAQLRLALK